MAYGGYGHGYRHGGVGIYIGAPYMYPYYPPYPYAYYPPVVPVVIAPAPPPVYIEQQQPIQIAPEIPQQAIPATNYWYHCGNPDGYYPYIKECPGGWQKVTPTPPAQP